jgi:hypothetical protein
MHDEFLNQRLDGTIDIIEMLSAIMILFLVSQRSYVNAKYKILSILLDEIYKMLDCDTSWLGHAPTERVSQCVL